MSLQAAQLKAVIADLEPDLMAAGLIKQDTRPIWPEQYAKADAATACDFIFNHVHTIEEISNGELEIPDKHYLREIADEWYIGVTGGGTNHTVKSRRLIVSWFIGALELHYCGCTPKRVAIAARQFDGENGSRQFVWRAAKMYALLRANNPGWKLPDARESGGQGQERDDLTLANGSKIYAANSDPEKFRSTGAGIVRLEEASAMSDITTVLGQAATITQTKPGMPRGFVQTISNASDNPDFLVLIERAGSGMLGSQVKEEFLLNPHRPVERHKSASGARVMRVHYTADEEKQIGSDWYYQTKADTPPTTWAREMEGDVSAMDGDPVFPMYEDSRHCPEPARSSPIAVHDDAVLICGWDNSTATVHLAAVLLQIVPPYNQVQVIGEWTNDAYESMESFAPKVNAEITAIALGAYVHHVGDPAGTAKQGATGESNFDVAYRVAGIEITPSENNWNTRKGAVEWALMDEIETADGKKYPRMIVSGASCPITRTGFKGGYKWKEVRIDGKLMKREALKNDFSHPADSLQYACIAAREIVNAVSKSDNRAKKVKRPIIRTS